jgi:hypothetical protein
MAFNAIYSHSAKAAARYIRPRLPPLLCDPVRDQSSVSRITLSDVLLTSESDVLPSSGSRWL